MAEKIRARGSKAPVPGESRFPFRPIQIDDCVEVTFPGDKPIRYHILTANVPPLTTQKNVTPINANTRLAQLLLSQHTATGKTSLIRPEGNDTESEPLEFNRVPCDDEK